MYKRQVDVTAWLRDIDKTPTWTDPRNPTTDARKTFSVTLCAMEGDDIGSFLSLIHILPICLVTLAVSAAVGTVPWQDALPYLFGSAAGGWAAGMWGRKIPVKWLHRGLGILILWGGYRYLCY